MHLRNLFSQHYSICCDPTFNFVKKKKKKRKRNNKAPLVKLFVLYSKHMADW